MGGGGRGGFVVEWVMIARDGEVVDPWWDPVNPGPGGVRGKG